MENKFLCLMAGEPEYYTLLGRKIKCLEMEITP